PRKTPAAQPQRNAARTNAGETQRRLRTALAQRTERRQSSSGESRLLRVWLVPRSLQRPPAHVAHRINDGLSYRGRTLPRRKPHYHHSFQPHRPRSRKAIARSRGPVFAREKLNRRDTADEVSSVQTKLVRTEETSSLPRPLILPRRAMAPYCFIMVRICRYCFRTVLTSCTVVPLPFAMRFRRLPSMTL